MINTADGQLFTQVLSICHEYFIHASSIRLFHTNVKCLLLLNIDFGYLFVLVVVLFCWMLSSVVCLSWQSRQTYRQSKSTLSRIWPHFTVALLLNVDFGCLLVLTVVLFCWLFFSAVCLFLNRCPLNVDFGCLLVLIVVLFCRMLFSVVCLSSSLFSSISLSCYVPWT